MNKIIIPVIVIAFVIGFFVGIILVGGMPVDNLEDLDKDGIPSFLDVIDKPETFDYGPQINYQDDLDNIITELMHSMDQSEIYLTDRHITKLISHHPGADWHYIFPCSEGWTHGVTESSQNSEKEITNCNNGTRTYQVIAEDGQILTEFITHDEPEKSIIIITKDFVPRFD